MINLKLTIIYFCLACLFCTEVVALKIKGDWQQGALLIGKAKKKSALTFQDKPIKVGKDGLFIIGLHRDQPATATIVVTKKNKSKTYSYQVAPRSYNIQHIKGVKKDFIEPTAEQLSRAIQENKDIAKARLTSSYRRDFLKPFIRPVAGIITGVYGSQRTYNGVPSRPHFGWDIAAKTGTPVLSPNSGVVVYAQLDTFFAGGLIIIDHGFDLNSSLLHLSAIDVKVGDVVKAGQKVGEVGATGRVTGPHLDWRMNWQNNRIDPQILCQCD